MALTHMFVCTNRVAVAASGGGGGDDGSGDCVMEKEKNRLDVHILPILIHLSTIPFRSLFLFFHIVSMEFPSISFVQSV